MAQTAALQSFYASKRWREFRTMLIAERGCKCERCGKIIINPLELIGHHKKELTPDNYTDANISLNPDNVELICRDCHNAEHERFGHQAERKVYIVYGAPLSGKTTFAKQQMRSGDIIIDIDLIYSAISGLDIYNKPKNLYSNIIYIYNSLIDNIKTRYGKWYNAYIVGGYPEKYKRDLLAQELNAELIYCEATKDECISRLLADKDRQSKKKEWMEYISSWFDRYTE